MRNYLGLEMFNGVLPILSSQLKVSQMCDADYP